VKDSSFLADPDLAKALAMLSPEKFDKMIAYLHSPAAKRVRTNNHVERTNAACVTSRRCATNGVGVGPSSASSSWPSTAGTNAAPMPSRCPHA